MKYRKFFLRNRFLPFIWSLAFLIIGCGCSSAPKQIRLGYHLEKGAVYRQQTITEQTVRQVFNGEEQVVINRIQSAMSYKVIDVNEETSELEISYDTLDLIISLPAQEMHFSSKGNFWKQGDLFSQVLNAMAGKSFSMKLNNVSGKIIEISGIEKLFENVLSQFMTGNEEQISSVMEMLNKSYGEGAFRDAFESANGFFTTRDIKPGDSWESNSTLSNVNAELTTTWKLEKLGKKEAELKGSGTLVNDASTKEVYVEGVSTRLDLSGTQNASMNIDHRTGWINSGKIEQHFEGVVHLREEETGEEAELPIQMINIIIYSTIE